MGVQELSDKGPDGTRLGQSAADLVGFHGASPTAQYALTSFAAVSTSAAVETSVCGYAFASSAQLAALVALVNGMRAALVAKGIATT
jgi:hypothetical protein